MTRTGIRFNQAGTLYSPTLNDDGQLTLGAGTPISLAFWNRRVHELAAQIGEVKKVDGNAFVPSGTSVSLRDRLLTGGELFEVVNVHVAHDDRNQIDHIGLQLSLVSG